MKRWVFVLVWLVMPVLAQESERATAVKATVKLRDGTELRGELGIATWMVESEALGRLTLPAGRVRSLEWKAGVTSATVTLVNGDRFQGVVLEKFIPLTAVFGPVRIPLESITEIQARAGGAGGGAPIEWEMLPIPRDHGWGGAMGEASKRENDVIVLRGWHVRSKQTYRAPLTFECEASVEELRKFGCLWINFAPAGQPLDRLPERGMSVTLGEEAGVGVHLLLEKGARETYQSKRLMEKPGRLKVGHTYRLKIEIEAHRVRVTLDGEVFETKIAVDPKADLQVYLRGWEPENQWHVRNTTAR